MLIADALEFLRGRLNTAMPRDTAGGSAEDLFVYAGMNGDNDVSFPANAVSLVLVRIEEDTAHRRPEPYLRVAADGARTRVEPEIRLNLFVLVVARFPDDYRLALHHLSRVVGYFQRHRVFNRENSPELHQAIPQLLLELVTPSFSEQNEIWGALRVAYQPSALYRVRMVVFMEEEGTPLTATKELIHTVVRLSQ
jgi:hypothetical protein